MRNVYPNELYHHGILGMHWGVRNGPPYPLGSGDHSSSEKKAGWRKSLGSNAKDTYKKARSKVSSGVEKSKKVGSKISEETKKASEKISNPIKDRWNNLSDEQKKTIKNIAIGVGVAAGAAVIGFAAYKLINKRISLKEASKEASKTSNIIANGKDVIHKNINSFGSLEISTIERKRGIGESTFKDGTTKYFKYVGNNPGIDISKSEYDLLKNVEDLYDKSLDFLFE